MTEPITVFGPNVAKATGLLGELLRATVILYEVAPVSLVHLRIIVLDVAENIDICIAVHTNEISEILYSRLYVIKIRKVLPIK